MNWPSRLLSDIAAEASFLSEHLGGPKITVHMVKLGLTLQWCADRGMTLNDARAHLSRRSREVEHAGETPTPFTRRYGRAICQLFGLYFPDFEPRKPLDLPLE